MQRRTLAWDWEPGSCINCVLLLELGALAACDWRADNDVRWDGRGGIAVHCIALIVCHEASLICDAALP